MERGELIRWHQQLDRPRLAGRAPNESKAFELNDHLVHAGCGDAEEPLEVGLRWWLAVEQYVRVDEGEVLALPLGKRACGRWSGHGSPGLI